MEKSLQKWSHPKKNTPHIVMIEMMTRWTISWAVKSPNPAPTSVEVAQYIANMYIDWGEWKCWNCDLKRNQEKNWWFKIHNRQEKNTTNEKDSSRATAEFNKE